MARRLVCITRFASCASPVPSGHSNASRRIRPRVQSGPRSDIPVVTHVDCPARIQTVHREINPRCHAFRSAFEARTCRPALMNASPNVRGEPVACTPEDAFGCFVGTEIDALVAGSCCLREQDRHSRLKRDYEDKFELDQVVICLHRQARERASS
ncbi:MAG TPA: carbamoyltransferase C-terminal domain-containing protein [Alphaproteobacteria bacterium]